MASHQAPFLDRVFQVSTVLRCHPDGQVPDISLVSIIGQRILGPWHLIGPHFWPVFQVADISLDPHSGQSVPVSWHPIWPPFWLECSMSLSLGPIYGQLLETNDVSELGGMPCTPNVHYKLPPSYQEHALSATNHQPQENFLQVRCTTFTEIWLNRMCVRPLQRDHCFAIEEFSALYNSGSNYRN